MNYSSLIRKSPKMMRFKSHTFEDMALLLHCVMETGGITGTRVGFTPSGGLSDFESAGCNSIFDLRPDSIKGWEEPNDVG